MAKTTYQHYNLKKQSRQSLVVKSFSGVDYSSQKFNVESKRAIDLLNFIYVDNGTQGTVEKRQGYTQKAKVPTFEYIPYPFDGGTVGTTVKSNANEKQFNGMWHFLAEDGNYHTVAHIGKLLFEIKKLDEMIVEFELITNTSDAIGSDLHYHTTAYEHLNQKSMAFVGNNRLWFLGGNKYMLLGFRSDGQIIYEPVEESDFAFVPTTCISITYKNARVNSRSSFDYANNLTQWRKNTCLSGTGKDETDIRRTKYYEYTLDAPIKTKNTVEDVAALSVNKSLSSISLDTQKDLAKIHIKVEELVVEDE